MSEQVIQLKRGSYNIHVFLEEGRGFFSLIEGESIDLIVSFTALGKTKTTKPLHKITPGSAVTWGEHFFFEISDTAAKAIESQRLLIEVKDHKTILKDSLIGSYEIDLTYIYYQQDHCIKHQWIILSNPRSERFDVLRGYLRLGVSILHEKDKPIDLTLPGSSPEEMLAPPQVKPATVQLVVQVLKSDNLPNMDLMGGIDAFIAVRMAGAEIETSIQKVQLQEDNQSLSVYWYEELFLPVMQPCVSNTLVLTVWDHDIGRPNDLIGSINFNWDAIIRGEFNDYFWANLYGAPPRKTGKEAELMNHDQETASYWRGRVLLRIFATEDKAIMTRQPITSPPDIKTVIRDRFETGEDYEIRVQVFSAVGLPKKSANYSIKVQWADLILPNSSIKKADNGTISWFENIGRRTTVIPNGALLPDIFVYLQQGNDCICFHRLKAEAFMDPDKEPVWVKLFPDKTVGVVTNHWEGGFVKIKVYLGVLNKIKASHMKKNPIQEQKVSKVLCCYIFQCRKLPPADATGSADPYVKVYYAGNEVQTNPTDKKNCLNPLFYEVLSMEIEFSGFGSSPPIIVYVMDYDTFGSDDLIGMKIFDFSEVCDSPDPAPDPKWYLLNMGDESTEEGEILISFGLFDLDNVRHYDIVPPTQDVTVEINVLGLRELRPAVGFLPVNKAYFKIDLNSLAFPNQKLLMDEIKTQPFEPGSNPNINAVLSFPCKLPKVPLYCPSLTCNVHDYVIYGLSQPLLGTFSIFLGDIVRRSHREVKEPQKRPGLTNISYLTEESDSDEEKKDFAPLLGKSSVIQPRLDTCMPTINESSSDNQSSCNQASLYEVSMDQIIQRPQFIYDNRKKRQIEINKPGTDLYMPIGYNRNPDDGLKHYRHYVSRPLEHSKFIDSTPFNIFEIKTGQSRGLGGPASVKSNVKVAGKFKGLIRVVPDGLSKESDYDLEFKEISRKLMNQSPVLIRVYILDALDLKQKDTNSDSDPYLVLKLGKKKINEKKNYFQDCSCPKFCKMYEFNTCLPGESVLRIQVWDHDDFFPDEKIGTTEIDLEDRYFSSRWQLLLDKPIETRPLLVSSTGNPQGFIRLWVDILDSADREIPSIDLSPKPPGEFELRVIVWRSEQVENADFEGVSDLYLRAWINNENAKETDTHFRCQRGAASWNWRLKFPLEVNETNKVYLNLQLWDRDYLSANDVIGDALLDLRAFVNEAWEENSRLKYYGRNAEDLTSRILRKQHEKFWIDFHKKKEDGRDKFVGKVLISVEVLPIAIAKACPVSTGRDEPNTDPYLPPPVGRFKLSWNPLAIISQMCGPEFKAKICGVLCCLVCCVLFVFMFPSLFADLFVNIIT